MTTRRFNTKKQRGFTFQQCSGSGQPPEHPKGDFTGDMQCTVCLNYYRPRKDGTIRGHGEWV